MRDQHGRIVEGVYRIDAGGSVQRIITHEVDRPNGIVVTPDDRYLYVADNNIRDSVPFRWPGTLAQLAPAGQEKTSHPLQLAFGCRMVQNRVEAKHLKSQI